jgi:tetratricopeptide (TPR) repeat protein
VGIGYFLRKQERLRYEESDTVLPGRRNCAIIEVARESGRPTVDEGAIMNPLWKQSARLCVVTLVALGLALPAAAQFSASILGEVKDKDAKPFPGVAVILEHQESPQKVELLTDRYGRYSAPGLRGGVWKVTFKVQNQVFHVENVKLMSTEERRVDVNVKEMLERMSAADKEEARKREEEQSKFQGMKAHFDAGRLALEQARATRAEMNKLPSAERAPLAEKLTEQANASIASFEKARDVIDPKDLKNLVIVLGNLGEAYEEVGRYDDAVAAYQRALTVDPAQAGFYNKLGTAQARAGKYADAAATCEKGRAVDPAQAGICFRNVVIVMQNPPNNKMTESLDIARKAVEVDPNNADGHFFLARALLAGMGSKKEGDKIVPVIQPGTVEAYQKYLELAPTGRFAKDAQEGLETLKLLGAPIDTKIRVPKKRP